MSVLEGVLSYKEFLSTIDTLESKGQVLGFGIDVNVVRFVDGLRENCNGDEVAHRAELEELYTSGCTLQVIPGAICTALHASFVGLTLGGT